MNYYNEIDPYAAQWLRNLIAAGHLAPGFVDTRSIEDVLPSELAGYTQCHFFCGIGGWPLALRRAGWPDSRPVWTGSCPCQPFSETGEGAGFADERHLWPAFQWLIQQCCPGLVFGEQVSGKRAEPWIDLVHADLEAMGYAFGCVAFPAAGVGAPFIGDRVYWVGQTDCARLEGHYRDVCDSCESGRLPPWPIRSTPTASGSVPAGPVNGFWRESDWILGTDGKRRAVRPGTFPLANGIPGRVGRLRAYGNAINVEQAVEFIRSVNHAEKPCGTNEGNAGA